MHQDTIQIYRVFQLIYVLNEGNGFGKNMIVEYLVKLNVLFVIEAIQNTTLTWAKYDMTDVLLRTSLNGVTSDADRICSQCNYKLRSTNVCTCCHQKFTLYRVIPFDTNNYDFEEYIVS